MTDLGTTRQFLRLEIRHNSDGPISLSQQKYIKTMINRFHTENPYGCVSPMDTNIKLENEQCKDNPTDKHLYQSIAGSLIYASTRYSSQYWILGCCFEYI
jgi:hypothetical protein